MRLLKLVQQLRWESPPGSADGGPLSSPRSTYPLPRPDRRVEWGCGGTLFRSSMGTLMAAV